MLKVLLFVAIATVQCLEVKDKLNEDPLINQPAQQGQRSDGFLPRSFWPNYDSWSRIYDPQVTPSSAEHVAEVLTRLAALEQKISGMNELLKNKELAGPKRAESRTNCGNKEGALPCKESAPLEYELPE